MPLLAKERYGVHGCRVAADCALTESAGALEAVSFSLPSSERVVGLVGLVGLLVGLVWLVWLVWFGLVWLVWLVWLALVSRNPHPHCGGTPRCAYPNPPIWIFYDFAYFRYTWYFWCLYHIFIYFWYFGNFWNFKLCFNWICLDVVGLASQCCRFWIGILH